MNLYKKLVTKWFHKNAANLLIKEYDKNVYNNSKLTRLYSTQSRATPNKILKLGLLGVTVGAAFGTGYSLHKLNDTRTHIATEMIQIPFITEVPKLKPSRQVINSGKINDLKLTLYQYQTCPFCCKVRAFLDYYGISYNIIEVDPVLRQSIKWSQYKKVPILLAEMEDGYQQFHDSSMIISALSSYIYDKSQSLKEVVGSYPYLSYLDDNGKRNNEIMNKYFIMYNSNNVNRKRDDMLEEQKWRKWADQVLVHVLSPNVYRNPKEALQTFNWFSEVGEWEKNFPTWERILIIYVGAMAMWIISKNLKKRYSLKDDVRCSLYDECNFWMKALKKKGTLFMGGDKPNLADLAVYGVLSSIEGCDAFKDLLTNTKISSWYYNMKKNVKNNHGDINELFN